MVVLVFTVERHPDAYAFFFSRRLFKYFDKILSECEHRFIATTLYVMLTKFKNIYQHDSHWKKKKKPNMNL